MAKLTVTVRLHTILQRQLPSGQKPDFQIDLPAGATVGDVLDKLGITLDPSALILVIQHKVVDPEADLVDGDRLDIFPAISGG